MDLNSFNIRDLCLMVCNSFTGDTFRHTDLFLFSLNVKQWTLFNTDSIRPTPTVQLIEFRYTKMTENHLSVL